MAPAISLTGTLLTLLILSIPLLSIRLLALLPSRRLPPRPRVRGSSTRLLVVLGSGGHTAEMLAMLRKVDLRDYTTRIWVVGEGDDFSTAQAREFESQLCRGSHRKLENGSGLERKESNGWGKGKDDINTPRGANGEDFKQQSYEIKIVPRARQIHQSLLTTPFSALRTLVACIPLLLSPSPPDLILTNGPATATILIFASLTLRFFDVKRCHSRGEMRTIYVESWARVKRLSLSGKLLCGVVDRFVVQWEGLEGVKGWNQGSGEFRGVLV